MADYWKSDAESEEPEPYEAGLVERKLRIIKPPLEARAIGILTNVSIGRDMRLIPSSSRAVRRDDVHELVCTNRECVPGGTAVDIGYLAFIRVEESGVLAIGDSLKVDGTSLGQIVGFNEVHAPNHINIVIYMGTLSTGLDEGWRPGTRLTFHRQDDGTSVGDTGSR